MKKIIKLFIYVLLFFLPFISIYLIMSNFVIIKQNNDIKELISIIANIIGFFAFFYSLLFFIEDKLASQSNRKSRHEAFIIELKYNTIVLNQINKVCNEKTTPFSRYEINIIEQILSSGEYYKNRINALWSLYISMKKTNKIMDRISSLSYTRNHSFTDPIQNHVYNEEVAFQFKCLNEELQLTNQLIQEI